MREYSTFILIILVLGVCGVGLYYFYERPTQIAQQDIEYVNFSVYAVDESGNYIEEGYSFFNGFEETIGKTSPDGAVLEQMLINHTATFKSLDLSNRYYTYFYRQEFFGQDYQN